MARENDNKRGGVEDEMPRYNRQIEARFNKQARANTGQDGKIDGRRMDRDFADNTGGKGHPDRGEA